MASLKFLLLAVLVGYAAITLLVWLAQERLLFFPQPVHGKAVAPQGWHIEEVRLQSRDGTPLAGVLVRPPVERPPLVIYFGGNAEEVTAFAPEVAQAYGDRAVLLVNYRGYGDSGGKPGERGMVSDALEVFDWAASRKDLDAGRIALHGRSLGTGVAVQVAAARPARCVILTSPFAAASDVAKEIYPWLPVAWLMRHPFDSAAHAPKLRMPALFLVGGADTVIAPHHSEKLAALWGGPVERVSFEGFGHNDLSMNPRYDASIQAFLARCL